MLYLHILCAQMDIFCELCKKDKKKCREKTYFSNKFYYFYIGYIKNHFFIKTTSWAYRIWRYTHNIFV
jgi:hypothetical protein